MSREIPRNVEVLIKKAAVDPAFKKLLMEKRAGAAEAIGLKLTAAEEAMLAAVPLPQLEGIVARIHVDTTVRPAFLGNAARTMLATLGATLIVCQGDDYAPETSKRETENAPQGPSSAKKRFADLRGSEERFGYGMSGGSAGSRAYRPTKKAPGEVETRRLTRTVSLGIRPYGPAEGEERSDESRRQPARRTKANVIATVRKNFSGIQNAYDEAVANNPSLGGGKMVARFTVSPDGAVSDAAILDDTIEDTFLHDAILTRMKTWRFSKALGEDVTITYSFVFVAEEG